MPTGIPRTKRVLFAVVGGLILGLVIIGAMITLSQGPASSFSRGSQGLTAGLAPSAGGGIAESDASYNYGKTAMPPIAPDYYGTGGQTAAEVDQKIIKTGALRLTVDSVSDSLGRAATIASTRGGFVQQSSSSERGDGSREGSVVIRVPSAQFEAAMADLKGMATIVNHESTSGQDVTEQYTDLAAQLRNAKAQEEEYLRILKKAATVEDILRVQERLGMVRGQIESLEGRLKYLENATSLSTISASLAEEPEIIAPTKEFRPGTVVKQAVQALVQIGQSIVAALIWIAIIGGGVGVPLLILALIVRAFIRRKR